VRASRTAALAATLLAVGAVRAQAPVRADADPIAAAEAAWGRGDFPAALRTLRAALHGPEARRAGGPAGTRSR
jgi:hypothetical protein